MRALTYIILTLLLVGCGSETIQIPEQSEIQEINICQGRHDCNIGKSMINDQYIIKKALQETLKHSQSWQTEPEMALTTGWLTYPTPTDTVAFKGRDNNTLLVLWFGSGWIGTWQIKEGKHVKFFKRVSAEEVKSLRLTLSMKNP
ncbi:hypothetical protein D3879_07065 [Pseudomonas cavernicola]|uniref:Lipoprotein n=1 Tax=Pseudomonas cavernicola TaxID=2320866 RepID=A0A418XKL2_9PSED|nr:hypothetical protein [Pseudomonas cavernicola]RJG13029.1 hypothetical protein D3879_07065 [Pseudomonas cavernicola]